MVSEIETASKPMSDPNPETGNKSIVDELYTALAEGDRNTIGKLLTDDLEWWFHGPPRCEHMMRMLTGDSNTTTKFRFVPRSIEVIGECVIVEGWEGAEAYWVHVWIVKDGRITEFREYFNTWLTIEDVKPTSSCRVRNKNHTLWQSNPRDLFTRSLPTLLLAI
ncbi:hypothetical protein K2173_008467 [Erythroxylum novogranatense]|uniref:Wound-induced protein 1 n=1 Tax=Erythroxylum novogranatense TaxID=1862640 RepID=A0AAV8UBX9_9ROSI|nr:hypothetical protein K2173_008467 [Erythroxylum novogranatense]